MTAKELIDKVLEDGTDLLTLADHAPKLAKALRVALFALRERKTDEGCFWYSETLKKIDTIAKDET